LLEERSHRHVQHVRDPNEQHERQVAASLGPLNSTRVDSRALGKPFLRDGPS